MTGIQGPPDWRVAVESPLIKVFREKARFRPCAGRERHEASLAAAGNEYQNFQLVLSGPDGKDLKAVRVEASDLIHQEAGSVIPKGQIELFRVGYVQTRKCLYPVEHVGWWPDPLLPMAPFDVKADEVQSVWVADFFPALTDIMRQESGRGDPTTPRHNDKRARLRFSNLHDRA